MGNTGRPAWWSVVTWRDGVGGRLKREEMKYIHGSDSRCTPETNIVKQLSSN